MTKSKMMQRFFLRVWKRLVGRIFSYALGGASLWLVKQKVISEGEAQWLLVVGAGLLADLTIVGLLKLKKRFETQLAYFTQQRDGKSLGDVISLSKRFSLMTRLRWALHNTEEMEKEPPFRKEIYLR